ncbi:MAG: zinc-binding dehydrogenase, partial [Gammaproteobacteria bacterium]
DSDGVWIRAAVCREFGAPLSVERLRLSPPRAGQVRIRLSACAICHSDIIYMDGGWGGTPPIVFGHEAAGVVVSAGAGVSLSPDTRVIATLLRSCGACVFCEKGFPSQCEGAFDDSPHLFDESGKKVFAGLKTGAFAEEIVVDVSQVSAIPDSMPYDQASLLACGVLTGWGSVLNTAKVSAGDSVAVVGCGGVGLNCLQAAAAAGAFPIAAADISESKLELARKFGATDLLYAGGGMESDLRRITGGRGFDFVFMAAGSARAAEYAAQLVAKTGALVLVGMPPDGDFAKLNAATVANNHQRILGSKMGGARLRADIPRLLRMHREGKLKLAELIGGRYPLRDINAAVADARRGGALRNVIIFDDK